MIVVHTKQHFQVIDGVHRVVRCKDLELKPMSKPGALERVPSSPNPKREVCVECSFAPLPCATNLIESQQFPTSQSLPVSHCGLLLLPHILCCDFRQIQGESRLVIWGRYCSNYDRFLVLVKHYALHLVLFFSKQILSNFINTLYYLFQKYQFVP